ncbi:hypothetical protein JOB18_004432 [Solea senegalensis]|uniref:Uncharacterized protein n=1 Tax=Solea senegalensis TaxID=28829 RepID=A0AAV6R1D7_SOLSE|nr:hypothetical protein JOB18_004432 [Solea senegalensis]
MEECTQMFSITVCRPSLAWLPHDGCYDGATLCSAAAKDVHKDAARSPLAWKTYIRNQSDCSKISDAEQIRVHSFCSLCPLIQHESLVVIRCVEHGLNPADANTTNINSFTSVCGRTGLPPSSRTSKICRHGHEYESNAP